MSKTLIKDHGSSILEVRKGKGHKLSSAWLHSLVIFIEWMAASNVLVLVGRPLFLLESFLPFALCATSLLSTVALRRSRSPIVMSLALRWFSDSVCVRARVCVYVTWLLAMRIIMRWQKSVGNA